MKQWKTRDPRAMNERGVLSRSRMVVLEALEAQAREGATRDEITALVAHDLPGNRPQGSVGQALSYMKDDGYVVEINDRWYLKEHAPIIQSNGAHPAPLPTNGQRVQVAAQVQKRQGKTVSLFTSPREHSDVVSVKLVMKGVTVPIPLWGSMWICYGQTVPDWDAEKELYFNVETIRLLFKNGTQIEEHPAPSDTVTIAQG